MGLKAKECLTWENLMPANAIRIQSQLGSDVDYFTRHLPH